MTSRREFPLKQYAEVIAWHKADGTAIPIRFRLEGETTVFSIDRIEDVRPAASLKAGGRGMRYTCVVNENEVYLFDDRGFWFVEREQAAELARCSAHG